MTLLAPTLEAFFTTRLSGQLGASAHTFAAYRDTWRLLLRHAADTTGTPAHALDMAQLDADLIGGFLTHVEVGAGTASPPATLAWLRSTPCSPTPPCSTPSTPGRSTA